MVQQIDKGGVCQAAGFFRGGQHAGHEVLLADTPTQGGDLGSQAGGIGGAAEDAVVVAGDYFFPVFGGSQKVGGDGGHRFTGIQPVGEVGEATGFGQTVQREAVEVGDRFEGGGRGRCEAVFEALEGGWPGVGFGWGGGHGGGPGSRWQPSMGLVGVG